MCLHRRRVGASAEAVDPALAGRAVDCLQLAVRAQNPDHFRVLLWDRFNVDRVADPFPGLLLIDHCPIAPDHAGLLHRIHALLYRHAGDSRGFPNLGITHARVVLDKFQYRTIDLIHFLLAPP